jgi:CBS domain-containing protein
MRIHQVIRAKSESVVITITPDASVHELLALLAQHNIGAVVVSTNGQSVDGIVSERDVVRRLHSDREILEGPVSAIMTTNVHTCHPDQGVAELMTLMTEHRIRHVPVVSGEQLDGIMSIGDVVKNRISELQFERDQLDSYVQQA